MTIDRKPMELYKGFREMDFFEYVTEKHNLNNYSLALLENIVNYGQEFQHVSKGQFVHFLYDMISFIEINTILKFCCDEILTEELLNAKYK